MAETVTNKAANTATIANRVFKAASKTFADMTSTFASTPSSFDNPQDFTNKSASSKSTVTNKPLT